MRYLVPNMVLVIKVEVIKLQKDYILLKTRLVITHQLMGG